VISLLKTQLVVLGVTLALVEIALQLACVVSFEVRRLLASPWQTLLLPDARLVLRGNPLHSDADEAGYRNALRPARADVVALGDSQTYGPDRREEAWPSVLGTMLNRTVYNMAIPGYGPLQAYLQLDEALSFRPKLIVVAPYFGNDFYDSFLVFQRHASDFTGWVPPPLVDMAVQAEAARPLAAEVTELFRFGEAEAEAAEPASPLRRWLSENVRLYAFLRAVKDRLQPPLVTPLLSRKLETALGGVTPKMKSHVSVYAGAEWRTILTAPYRNRVIDDRDPRIRLGFELSIQAVHRIEQRCRQAAVALLVVLIPTKESVFFDRVADPEAHAQLGELVANENRLREEWIAELRARKIDYIDVRIALSQSRVQPYAEDLDGHPTALGHRLIAAEVRRRLVDGLILRRP
jgi:lysophospholipase L1-like esterase